MPPNCQTSRVALLINFIPPYRFLTLRLFSTKVKELTVFISTVMEPNRSWNPCGEGVDIVLQRNIMLRSVWRHPQGFSDKSYMHIPYDTFLQLMRRRPDVVISLEFGFRTLQAMLYRIFIPSSRLIVWVAVSERTEQGRGVIRRMLRQLIIKHADAFLVNGHSGRRYLMRFKVPKKRIFLVPPASDMEPFGNTSIERPQEIAYRLIYVGQLIERKGINLFLQVLCQWAIVHPDRRIEFWLAGEGPIRKELEVRTLPKNIFLLFLGNIDYDDLSQVYAKAGIFVFPTLADDWGMVVNEAMAAGLPVLGSIQSQAVEDLVQDGTNGWLFDPENPKDTFRALEKALETPFYVLETMRQKSRQTAMKITPLTMVEQIVHSINYCLSLS